jgi:hypothetical protein
MKTEPTAKEEKRGEVTTIWSDGTVCRTKENGMTVPRPVVPAVKLDTNEYD